MKTAMLFLALLIVWCGNTAADNNVRRKRADNDVDLNALQTLVQQQAAVIQSLQAEQEAEKNRITALENENSATKTELADLKNRVATISKPVAFTVRFRRDDPYNGVPVGNNSLLRFDNVALNVGNGYDPQTGIFTAPVSGVYSFFLTMMGVRTHGHVDLAVVKQNVTLDIVYSRQDNNQGSGQVTSHVAAGEQVWVRHYQGVAVRGAWYTVFTGYLLYAD